MLVLKSTHNQMMSEAKAAGAAALSETIGELTVGLAMLGLRAEPKPGETTAAMVLRYLRGEMSESAALRIERDTAQRERDEYRPDALKYRRNVAHLIPGGKPRKSRPVGNGVEQQAPTH